MTEPLVLRPGVDCGAVLSASDRAGILAGARRIEAAGFDSLWVGDHIAFHFPILESLTLLGFAAAATERVELGTSVYLLPLRHPTTTAKVTASLDVLSGGRLTLGIGVGGEYPTEFRASGVPVEERGSRSDEAIGILRRLWTEEDVEHRGRHFDLGPVSISPRPLQAGGPPILVGGRRPAALRRAGRLGDGYLSHMCSAARYRQNLDAIRRHAREAGRREIPFRSAAFVFTLLDDVYERALDRAAGILERMYRVSFRDAARRYCLLGRPDDCLEQLQGFVDAGCRSFVLSPLGSHEEFVERAQAGLLGEIQGLKPRGGRNP